MSSLSAIKVEYDARPGAGIDLPQEGPSGVAVVAFWVIQLSFNLLILAPGAESIRIFLRAGSLLLSFLFLVFLRGQSNYRYPAMLWAVLMMGVLCLGLVHPDAILTSGVASVMYYFSVLSLIFWVPRVTIQTRHFIMLLAAMWIFSSASAVMGYLQVHYPGHFTPNVTALYKDKDWQGGLSITLSNGERIPRPFGLTDSPGGAAGSGLFCVLFGMAFFFYSGASRIKLLALGSVFLGMFALYVCQIRVMVVMTGIELIVWFVVLLIQRDSRRASILLGVGGVMAVAVFAYAASVGGSDTVNRLSTLVAASPTDVYNKNRGHFLADTLYTYIPEYPIGAGMGRWGMMNNYFSKYAANASESLWAEIQITGWVYDGGVPLVIIGYGLVLTTIYTTWRFVRLNPNHPLVFWAGIILAYDVGALAGSFNYHAFVGNAGQEFFLLNVALYGAFWHANQAGEFSQAVAVDGDTDAGDDVGLAKV